jgi:tight adherence protein C
VELLLLGLLLATSVGLVAYSLMPGSKQRDMQVLRRVAGRRGGGKDADKDVSPIRAAQKASTAEALVKMAAPYLSKPVMPKNQHEQSTLRIKLAMAGYRSDSAPTIFLASKTVMGGVLAVLAVVAGLGGGQGAQNTVGMVLFLGGMGFMLPNGWLWLGGRQRGEKIRNGLPDTLDLMVISVEAGLGLDAAIQRVAKELMHVHPELSEELTIATMETQMGLPRAEALANFATRTGLPEIKSLVAVVNQAEKFGTSIARTLRNQADAMRVKRRQAAEERAQKTAVKLLVPLILFIFPAMMIVLGGPAMIKLLASMGNMQSGVF